MTYYHGGQRGLRVGTFLLPPAETGAKATSDYSKIITSGRVMRADRVYVTTDKTAAIMFGAMHPSGGAVYTVEPDGEIAPDPDCDMPGLSFECARARIVSGRNVNGFERRKVFKALGVAEPRSR